MKHKVTKFKSLAVALKELEKFIRNGDSLQTGKPLKKFGGLRPRELVANWLICVVVNFQQQQDGITFTSDPLGGDGIIYDTTTGDTWPTEHVFVPKACLDGAPKVEKRILTAIRNKQNKGGKAYAEGKTLIVFSNAGGGEWYPNKVAKSLPQPLDFDGVWVISLQTADKGEYIYGITQLDMSRGNAPTWIVRISKDFETWRTKQIQ